LRVPRFDDRDGFDEDDRNPLAKRVAYQAAIESRYRQGAAFRSLLEDRDEKRDWGIFPTVDAEDPFGHLLGRFVLVGPGIDEFEDCLRRHISQPGGRDVVDDAPEFAVRIPIKTPDRRDCVQAMRPVASRKNLSLTSEAVTIIRALTGSPYDAARAINQLLPEDQHRDIRIDEVRVALATYAERYSEQRLLPETDPSLSKIVAALLRTKRPLSKSEIAERAGVAASTVSKHLPSDDVEGETSPLEALGLVTEDAGGYRLALTFATDEERGAGIVPEPVETRSSARDLLYELVLGHTDVEDAGRTADPGDPLGAAFCGPVPDYQPLRDTLPWISPWIRVARLLCDEPDPEPAEAQLGKDPDRGQIGLETAVARGATADD
ncbi:MAG: winged helix-turn-helix domain-containing protein, partial [Halovenus sp.]